MQDTFCPSSKSITTLHKNSIFGERRIPQGVILNLPLYHSGGCDRAFPASAALRISRDGVRDVTPSECLSPALIWWASVGCARIAASNALTHSELFQQALLVRLFSLRPTHCAIGTIRIRLIRGIIKIPI
ncbi:hypothetical protein NPIL_386811 [Nephila pilipes]|uniref:Uncharacterized protein n=1 Tax=Nephila pilipes TaxID=299642 RepID=A0A8X6PY73_NEPPI|nr:hypothetical protein NPIL_386811 [Nephila pilipes]